MLPVRVPQSPGGAPAREKGQDAGVRERRRGHEEGGRGALERPGQKLRESGLGRSDKINLGEE